MMAPVESKDEKENGHVGPHPSFIQVAQLYVFEQELQKCMARTGVTEAKEDNIRLQGIAWIDSVRKALHLPVRTYNTAAVYYHKFRLVHADHEYGYIDAAAAALFTACKVEDTLKKSKEILCASYNLKLSQAEQVTPDDAMFEAPSKSIIGLERLMLEASGFDFRSRYPQKLLLKLAKHHDVDQDLVGKTAYDMSLDSYRTFAPLKQTTQTLAIACVELSGRLLLQNVKDLEAGKYYPKWHTSRAEVMETLLDLLDLYTHHRTSTIVGEDHALNEFIDIRIALNKEASSSNLPRYTNHLKRKATATTNGVKPTNGIKDSKSSNKSSPISPRDPHLKDIKSPTTGIPTTATGVKGRAGLKDGTVRFMLDAERELDEKREVERYFKIEEEEYEVEVERERRR